MRLTGEAQFVLRMSKRDRTFVQRSLPFDKLRANGYVL